MEEDSKNSMNHSVFNIGNYWFTGIGHIIIDYAKAIGVGYRAIVEEAAAVLQQLEAQDPDYQKKAAFLKAEIIIFSAAIKFAHRYWSVTVWARICMKILRSPIMEKPAEVIAFFQA